MRRRYSRRQTSATDWPARFTPVWPVVTAQTLPTYVSIFSPRGVTPTYGIQPTSLAQILSDCAEPALYHVRADAEILPRAPQLSGPFPPSPAAPERPIVREKPQWTDYAPQHPDEGFWATVRDIFSGARGARERLAQKRFETDKELWKKSERHHQHREHAWQNAHAQWEKNAQAHYDKRERLEHELERQTQAYTKYVERMNAERAVEFAKLDELLAKAPRADGESIEQLVVSSCLAIPMPLTLPERPTAHFDAAAGVLLLSVEVPNLDEIPIFVPLKTKQRAATEKERRSGQEYLIHALSLRLLHEIFGMNELSAVQVAGVNMSLAFTDRRNGKRVKEVISSLVATRDEFAGIDIGNVDAKLCFRSLKGIATPSFQEPAPVRPLLSFGNTDGRIVASREIVDNLEQETNLAALDWEDFEHIVRELFAKLFSARAGAEVHVTRASRDYGVDALIFDPDPIHGGKFVIQAKRYVNTVDIAAVRDLYGTVQNEGANRGYLVTTSSFGPEAHSFAKGKPLTLIDGGHLLHLLREHGYTFRIDLAEARQVLHGRA